ncbi:hypothetical protein DF011_25760 [Burkholderia ubonensis]|nr:hypothetical protein CJO70_16785 [Burkholderia ubonensis]PAJ93639.1 hypothetical protein CJO69_15165 [Burkholderia ubonensis]RQP68901.1 hypothetical protein DF013_27235 [Burkholderia ubonensis]RQP75846.1 hypothetical protein DF014_26040 [Burkholderia ubonensis]RQQ06531.1 hypothetical protein DF011_25760 [Burkholderia ubonensis]
MLERGGERVHVVVGSRADGGRRCAFDAPAANSSHDCRQPLKPPQTISMHYVLRFGHQLGAGGNRWEAHALALSESIRLFRHAHCCFKVLAAMTVVKDDGRHAPQHPRQGPGR